MLEGLRVLRLGDFRGFGFEENGSLVERRPGWLIVGLKRVVL